MNAYELLNKYPSVIAIDTPPAPYNRLVYQPESGVTLVEPLITTTIQVAPKPFRKGDLVTVTDCYGKQFAATYVKKDEKDRSFISIKDGVMSCYTYQLSHRTEA